MRDQHDIRRRRFCLDNDLEVASRYVILRRETDSSRLPRQLIASRVRRRLDALQRHGGRDRHVDIELPQRMLFEQVALQRVAVAISLAAQRQHLRVSDLHPLFGMRFDRKDTSLEEIAASPFQQTGIASLAQNRLIDFASTLLLKDVRFDQFVTDPHPEPADRSIRRQWKEERSFRASRTMINERFFDHRPRDLVSDIDRHSVISDRQRNVASVDVRDQRTERLLRHRTLEAEQPSRCVIEFRQLPDFPL